MWSLFRWRRLQGEELNFYLVLFMGGAFEEITRGRSPAGLNDMLPLTPISVHCGKLFL